jgi:hypothetical protein
MVQETYGEPYPVERLKAEPVPLRKGTVVAQEVQEVAMLAWETAEPVRIALGGRGHVFPAGSSVSRLRTASGPMDCFWDSARKGDGPRSREGIVVCLADEDGDNRRETAVLLDMGRAGRLSKLPLGGATAFLALDGFGPRDFRAHRRIRVASVGSGGARLVLEHGVTFGDGRRGPRPKRPPEMLAPIREGEVAFGGIRLRLARSAAGGWTVTPLDPHFPPWVKVDCEGNVRVGGGEES